MLIDVQVSVKVQYSPRSGGYAPVYAHIRVLSDPATGSGRWLLIGPQDGRLPQFTNATKHWRSHRLGEHYTIKLLHNQKPWAELWSFPDVPKVDSHGVGVAYRLPGGPGTANKEGHYVVEWGLIPKAKHGNLPTFDPNDSALERAIASCTTDTGWRFDTSAGASGAVGAGAGVGGGTGYLVFKRKEPGDVRRWKANYTAAGIGVMTPGGGVSASREETFSRGLSHVMAGPGLGGKFSVADFEGTVVMFEFSVGASLGKGSVGVGRSGAVTLYLFLGVTAANYSVLDFTQLKAYVAVASAATGGGKGQGGSVAAMAYGGVVTSVVLYKS